jgi:hypothetical protein
MLRLRMDVSPFRRLSYLRRRHARRRQLARLPTGDAAPVEAILEEQSPTLLVAFGGLNRRLGMPPFEFMRLIGDMPIKRAFIRDPRQAWYHRGLPGYGDGLEGSRAAVERILATPGIERTVFVGVSAGGYAALLFGGLLGADVVLAFSPQTTIDVRALHALGDRRWDDHLRPLEKAGLLDRRWLDLTGLPPGPEYRVYFDEELELDRRHAERLKGIARLYRFGGGGHQLVQQLRDNGALGHVLQGALA